MKERRAAKTGRKASKAEGKPRRERRNAAKTGREPVHPSPLAQALPLLERLRPPSRGNLLTVLALVAIAFVAGAVFWLSYGLPAPW